MRSKIKDVKERIKNLNRHLRLMKKQSVFVPVQEEKEDPVLIRNLSGCIMPNLLERLHKAGFMYGADDDMEEHWDGEVDI